MTQRKQESPPPTMRQRASSFLDKVLGNKPSTGGQTTSAPVAAGATTARERQGAAAAAGMKRGKRTATPVAVAPQVAAAAVGAELGQQAPSKVVGDTTAGTAQGAAAAAGAEELGQQEPPPLPAGDAAGKREAQIVVSSILDDIVNDALSREPTPPSAVSTPAKQEFDPLIQDLCALQMVGKFSESRALEDARRAFIQSYEAVASDQIADGAFAQTMKTALDTFTAAIRASEKNPRLSAVIESLKSVVNAIFKCLQDFCTTRNLFAGAAWLKQDHLIEPSVQTKVRKVVGKISSSSMFAKKPEAKPDDAAPTSNVKPNGGGASEV